MRILLTSDIHCDKTKLHWFLEEAPGHDALLAAGDFLDIFSKTDFAEQKAELLRWKSSVLARNRAFAWCSGNHDFFQDLRSPMSGASPLWMKESSSSKFFLSDGESGLLDVAGGRIAVTTLPWPVQGRDLTLNGYRTTYLNFTKSHLRKGKKLQVEESVPWIVLCHEPPSESPLSAGCAANPEVDFARKMIEDAEPDFSLHGHVHQAPTTAGGNWIWQHGKTICFNAGQSEARKPPHFVLLDWKAPGDWTAEWFGEGGVPNASFRLN